jgi:predicted ester cyclase
VALAVGGAALLVFGLLFVQQVTGFLMPEPSLGYYPFGEVPLWLRLLNAATLVTYLGGLLLIPLGLGAGVRRLNGGRSVFGAAAGVGALLATSSPVMLAAVLAHGALSDSYGVGGSVSFYAWHVLSWPLGVALVGVAAAGVRGLRLWRLLPLALGLFALVPACAQALQALSSYPFYVAYSSGSTRVLEAVASLWLAVPILVGLGGMLLVRPLLRAPQKERLLVEAENSAFARRLYEEAWVEGNLEVVDKVAAPGLVDHYGDGRGPESLKRSITRLRRTFPDLRFTIEDQRASGDTVTTRWTASGTDLGGVLWYPPTGGRAKFRGHFVDRFEAGRIVEHRGESDTASLLEQLRLPRP